MRMRPEYIWGTGKAHPYFCILNSHFSIYIIYGKNNFSIAFICKIYVIGV